MGAKREISDALDRLRAQLATIPTAAAAIAMTEVNARHGIAMLAAEAMADHPADSAALMARRTRLYLTRSGQTITIQTIDVRDNRWQFCSTDATDRSATFDTFAEAFDWACDEAHHG